MNRYDILESLESRYIPVYFHSRIGDEIFADKIWKQVNFGSVIGQYSTINLNLCETAALERMLLESISQEQYEKWYTDQQKEYQKVSG